MAAMNEPKVYVTRRLTKRLPPACQFERTVTVNGSSSDEQEYQIKVDDETRDLGLSTTTEIPATSTRAWPKLMVFPTLEKAQEMVDEICAESRLDHFELLRDGEDWPS
jgi:hypothetical protein